MEGTAAVNLTEAWEWVHRGALYSFNGSKPCREHKRLIGRALRLTQPRVDRMRRRLDDLRAQRAGKLNPNRPKCLR